MPSGVSYRLLFLWSPGSFLRLCQDLEWLGRGSTAGAGLLSLPSSLSSVTLPAPGNRSSTGRSWGGFRAPLRLLVGGHTPPPRSASCLQNVPCPELLYCSSTARSCAWSTAVSGASRYPVRCFSAFPLFGKFTSGLCKLRWEMGMQSMESQR